MALLAYIFVATPSAMPTNTPVRKVPPDCDWACHKLHWALSTIDEQALANFFRAIRNGPVRPALVDEVNEELDRGLGFEEMFRTSTRIKHIVGNDPIELQVLWELPEELYCSIRVGLMKDAGAGAEWQVRFAPTGTVEALKLEQVWGGEFGMDDSPFN